MRSNFFQRTLTGSLFVIAAAGATLAGSFPFMILLFVMNFLCLFEFYELVLPDKSRLEKYLGLVAGTLIFGMFAMIFMARLSLEWYYHLIPIILFIFIVKLFEQSHQEFTTLAFQLLGLIYITLPIVMFAKLGYFNSMDYSSGLPLGIFILQWTSDTGAYLAGRSFGNRKLFERVSPKKTWEGSAGGFILSILIAWLLSMSEWFDDVNRRDWIIIAALIVIFGTFGDLFESLLKRNLKIKDSGTMMPGHGGVLDRFDGLLFSVPAIFFYLLFTN